MGSALTRLCAAWSVTGGLTFDPAALSTTALSAITLSVVLLFAEFPLEPADADELPLTEVGTRTRDVEVYDVGRRSIMAVGIRAPTKTQATTNRHCRRKSQRTRSRSNLCSDN